MVKPNIKELHQTLDAINATLNALKKDLNNRLELQQVHYLSKRHAEMVQHTKDLILDIENDVAKKLDSISAKNEENMNLAFKHGKTSKGKQFGEGVPGAPGADHIREKITQFLGGKRRKTRRKTRRWKTKKRRKRRTRRKKKRGYGGKSPKRRWSRKYKLSINCKKPKDFLKNNIVRGSFKEKNKTKIKKKKTR